MPDFKVNTDELVARRGHHDVIAGAIGSSAGMLGAAASAVADSAGHAGACAAGADWGARWEGHLAGHADTLRRSGDNLARDLARAARRRSGRARAGVDDHGRP